MTRSLLSVVLGIAALALVVASTGCGAPSAKYVGFATGVDAPMTGEEAEVKKAAAVLKEHPELHVVIIGHADKRGDAAMNKDLSFRRARSVQSMLATEGIDAGRMQVAARGEGDATTDADATEGFADDRRTEIFFFNPKNGDAQSHLKFKIEFEATANAEANANANAKADANADADPK